MNNSSFLKNIEDWILRWLTALCWWVDVRYNRTNTTVSLITASVGTFASSWLLYLISLNMQEDLGLLKATLYCFYFSVVSLCLWIIFVFLIPAFLNDQDIKINFKTLFLYIARRALVLSFIIILLFGFSLSLYIMCTEKIPPKEKVRRQTLNKKFQKNKTKT
jgi:hypothetical protein